MEFTKNAEMFMTILRMGEIYSGGGGAGGGAGSSGMLRVYY